MMVKFSASFYCAFASLRLCVKTLSLFALETFMSLRSFAIAILLIAGPAYADDWPQWLGPKRDGVWRETGIIEKLPEGGPKVLWRTPIHEGYAGPAVAAGRVYITDYIRAKNVPAPKGGFDKGRLNGVERVLSLDERTGEILWKHEYECAYDVSYAAGPRTTPVVSAGKVYTLGAMGDLVCLNADKGGVLWSKNLLKDYKAQINTWGYAGHPLIDGDRLIVLAGGPGSVAIAFDKDTGKEIWKNLSAGDPGYSPPIIHNVNGRRTLFVWHTEAINALDPASGKLIWSYPYARTGFKTIKAGLTVSMPRLVGDELFLTSFYEGAVLLKLHGAEPPTEIWRAHGADEKADRTKSLNSIMPTPIFKDGYIYGICSYGELRCLDAKTGARVWSTNQATSGEERWGNAFLVEHGDRCILFNEKGDLIIAKLSPKGYEELSRAKILEPTNTLAGRRVVWSHPAFADRSCFARNDREIIRVSLAKE
jgi:outer membrane protein assembly factor BamB